LSNTAKMTANYTEEEIKKAHEILFNEGVKMRYRVAGKEYVDTALKKRSDPFAGAMQDVSKSRQQLQSYLTHRRSD
jgi:hypothetical protein